LLNYIFLNKRKCYIRDKNFKIKEKKESCFITMKQQSSVSSREVNFLDCL
jgi:hypothetical protein